MGRGPLSGIKVIELPNIGPTQFAGMALGDLGAEVLRLDRAAARHRGFERCRHSVAIPKSFIAFSRRNFGHT